MRTRLRSELPEKYGCRICGEEKPVDEMLLVKTGGYFLLRPRCKDCHNARERGHRREYKTKYLRLWRKRNPELNESYWRQRNAEHRAELTARAYARFQKNHDAVLIQGRLTRHGFPCTLREARELLHKYGPCYPTRYGLTPKGLRECERIRAAQRRHPSRQKMSSLEIRIMLYEDGYYMTPSRQKRPYQHAARRLREYQAAKRSAAA